MILVIDSNAVMREMVAEAIRDAGFGNVDEAETAGQALAMLQEHRYSLVIIEPGQGNNDFLNRYKEISPATDVIILTGHPDHATAVAALRGRQPAALEYLEKPVDTRKLVALVNALAAQIELGPWRIDRIRKIPYYKNTEFQLPPQLLDVFEYFLKHPNERFDYPQVAHMLTGQKMDRAEAKAMLKSQMWRLRNTLDEVSGQKDVISTIPREGFCLAINPRLA